MASKLGLVVRDTITGFKGTVTGEAQYLTGCAQALVVPPVSESGAFVESQWFDDQRLEVVDPSMPKVELRNEATPGCDKPAPRH